jgi:hypothetical protein
MVSGDRGLTALPVSAMQDVSEESIEQDDGDDEGGDLEVYVEGRTQGRTVTPVRPAIIAPPQEPTDLGRNARSPLGPVPSNLFAASEERKVCEEVAASCDEPGEVGGTDDASLLNQTSIRQQAASTSHRAAVVAPMGPVPSDLFGDGQPTQAAVTPPAPPAHLRSPTPPPAPPRTPPAVVPDDIFGSGPSASGSVSVSALRASDTAHASAPGAPSSGTTSAPGQVRTGLPSRQ